MGQIIKKLLPAIIAVIVAIVVAIVVVMMQNQNEAQLKADSTQLSGLSSEISVKEASIAQDNDQIVKSSSGLDSNRKSSDDAYMTGLFRIACNWDSLDSYEIARNNVKQKYKLDENSSFMSTFMPRIESYTVDGKTTNIIDSGDYNMTFNSINSNVVDITGGVYSYVSVVNVASTNSNNVSASGKILVTYKLDSDSNLSDLKIYLTDK